MTSTQDEYHLRVYFHVIRNSDGIGGPTEIQVLETFNILNDNYNPHDIFFQVLGCEDTFFDAIDYIDNDIHVPIISPNQMFQINSHQDGIDIYLGGENSEIQFSISDIGPGGIADGGVAGSSALIVAGTWTINPPSLYTVTSNIVTHEMGHVLFLWHTHINSPCVWFGPGGPPCYELVDGTGGDDWGDLIPDTPSDPGLIFNVDSNCIWTPDPDEPCQSLDSNGEEYSPNTALIMAYTSPHCMSEITEDQEGKMKCSIETIPFLVNCLFNEIATNSSDYNNQTIIFGSNLIISKSVDLIISNSFLLFDSESGITIEEGGKLILDNTIVTANDCSDTWLGIEVRGTPDVYQGSNPNNTLGVHGVLVLTNGTSINHAEIGVTNSARIDHELVPIHSGGKIIADGASFINCREAVRIQKYTSTGPWSIHCQFYNTNFTWDDDFSFNYFGPMIKMYYAKKVEIHGCNFTNVNEDLFAMANIGYYHSAIYMVKSSINMDDDGASQSTMEGFNYGIVNLSKSASIIRNTEFKNYRSIWFLSNKTSRITENTFGNMTPNLEDLTGSVNIYDPVWQAHYGIYMEYSTGFWIEDNTFNFPMNNVREAGIFVRASGETYNQLYDNDFQNCHFGVIAFDDNRAFNDEDGFHLICNNFNNNHADLWVDHIDIEQNGWGISSKQGSGAVSAGNQFGTVIGQGFKIDNYLDHIDYFRVSSEDIEQPETDGDVTILTADDVNQCTSNVNKSKEEKKTDALAYKNEALSFRTQLDNLVDGGDTDALTDEVLYADYTEALELYYELMSKSPNLSVKVMEEAIDKEYTLPPVLLTLILQSNPTAGKSSKLQSKLDDRLIPLSEYQRYMIDQGKNLISEKEYLEAKLAYNELNFISLMNQAINLIVFDDLITDKESEIDFLLSGYEEVEHHYMKIDRALENQDYILAQSVLDNIPANFNLRERQDQEWIDYQVCYQLLIELEQNNSNSLTTIQIDNLMIIAEKHSNSAAGLAWQMLGQYDAAYVLEGMIAPGSHTKSLERNGKEEIINPFDDLQYIRIFPNPVDKIAILEFVGYESQLSITLMDSNGKLILSQIVSGNKLQEVLNLGEYANGLYNLTVSDKFGVLLNEQLIIKH